MNGNEEPRALKRSWGKTYLKTIAREIRGSFGRFAAIFGIVALGVAFLAGLLATTPDMKLSVDLYFDRTHMMDLFIKGTLGLTGKDAEALEALEIVETLMAARVTDTLIKTPSDEILTARIYGLPLEKTAAPGFLNRMEILEGRMPEKEDECLVQQPGGFFVTLKPGSVLTIIQGELYRIKEYTVTGVVKSPLYISHDREPSGIGNGRLGAAIYVMESCYTMDEYTDFFITLKGAASLTAFTDAYQQTVDRGAETIEALGKERAPIRREEVRVLANSTAREKLADGEAELEAARQEAAAALDDARQQLDEGRAKLETGTAELETGEAELVRGRALLEEEQQRVAGELAGNEAALNAGEAEIAAAKRTLAEGKAQLDAARPGVEKARNSFLGQRSSRAQRGIAQYDEGLASWEAGRKFLEEKEGELRQGRSQLEAGRQQAEAEFRRAAAELEAAEADLVTGRLELEAGRKDLAHGEAEYAAALLGARQKLGDGERELAEARQTIGDIRIDEPEWYVLDRNANVGCINYRMNAEKLSDIAKVFPVFFILVAALVALTTMTRMIEEERTQIGVLKALGYQKRVIAGKYLVYCGLTSITGSVVGMLLGFQGIPRIVYKAFGAVYYLPPLVTRFDGGFGLLACGIMLICTMGVSVSACYTTLWEKPARLMIPPAPRAGKRIFLEYIPPIWRSMKFTYKVSARNLLRYKKHFFMTVTGIAGCTALILTGFGLRDSMIDIARTQFEEIMQYDLRIEKQQGEAMDDELRAFLADLPSAAGGAPSQNWLAVHSESGYAILEEERQSALIYVPRESEALAGYINLRNRKTKAPLPFSASSCVISEKMAEVLGLREGESFVIENAAGRRFPVSLTGITENYVGNIIYAGPLVFSEGTGGAGASNNLSYRTLLVHSGAKDPAERDRLITRALSITAVDEAEFTTHTQQSYTNLLSGISLVVVLLIFAAGGLAIIVLYNLTNININERKRELATLRVLGFRQGEAAAYIFREIAVLSITGTAAGLLLGIPLHRFIIGVAETVDLMFGRHITALSFILSAAITLVFSGAVDLLMLAKIRRIEMAASMKAVE
ncbi:hypothetical protein FACS189468_6060 [Spirochaetia bacterium]|nr:hypothetical protein FACS189468_6060 [Spirochaetia bacterium]